MNFFVAEQPVLFVDDDESVLGANVQSLELAGISVRPFRSAAQALAEIGSDYPGIVVTDIRMPRMDGLQLFARIRDIDPEIPVILITGHADVPTAVAALHEGAFDFLAKPFAADHLVASARRALATRRLVIDNRRLRAAAVDNDPSPLIGDSPGIRALRDTIAQVAPADIDVLVEGETVLKTRAAAAADEHAQLQLRVAFLDDQLAHPPGSAFGEQDRGGIRHGILRKTTGAHALTNLRPF